MFSTYCSHITKPVILFSILLLTACGGGGGSAQKSTTTPKARSITPSSDYSVQRKTNGYRYYPQHSSTGADEAYKRGWTGRGQLILITEPASRTNPKKSAFRRSDEYTTRLESAYISNGGKFITDTNADNHGTDHGDMVAQLSIGKQYGIAPEATVNPYTFRQGDSASLNTVLKHYFEKSNYEKEAVAISNSWESVQSIDNIEYYNSTADDIGLTPEQKRNVRRYYKDAQTSLGISEAEALAKLIKIKDIFKNKNAFSNVGTRYSKLNCTNLKKMKNDMDAGFTLKYRNALGVESDIDADTLEELTTLECKKIASNKYTLNDVKRLLPNLVSTLSNFINCKKNPSTAGCSANMKDIPIVLFAAGNDGADNPSLTSSAIHLSTNLATLKEYWLAIVNIDADTDQLAQSSNKCGIAKSYCIGAYGDNAKIKVPAYRDKGSGTSAATPVVAGGLAVIKHAFPSKDNAWVRKRMLATASHETATGQRLKDRDGTVVTPTVDHTVAGINKKLSNEFGYGIMRLDLATSPISPPRMITSGRKFKVASSAPERNSKILSHPMFGDSIKRTFSSMKSYVFDSMQAEFKRNLGEYVSVPSYDPMSVYMTFTPQKTFLAKNVINVRYAYSMNSISNYKFQQKILSLPFASDNDIALSYTSGTPSHGTIQASFSKDTDRQSIQITMPKSSFIDYSIGILNEKNYILGSKISGGFGTRTQASTTYIMAKKPLQYNGWSLSASTVQSFTSVKNLNGVLKDKSDIHTSAYSLDATKNYKSGQFGISLHQPLRVERSIMQTTYVSAIDSKGNLSYKTQTFNASPSGRHIALEMFYKPTDSHLSIRSYYANDAGHIKGKTDYGIVVQYKKTF